jgi:hypothetical protein
MCGILSESSRVLKTLEDLPDVNLGALARCAFPGFPAGFGARPAPLMMNPAK